MVLSKNCLQLSHKQRLKRIINTAGLKYSRRAKMLYGSVFVLKGILPNNVVVRQRSTCILFQIEFPVTALLIVAELT